MDWKKCSVSQSVDNYKGFEQLVERGRQMHDQAVFDLFARLLSNANPFLKVGNSLLIRKQNAKNHNRGLSIKYST